MTGTRLVYNLITLLVKGLILVNCLLPTFFNFSTKLLFVLSCVVSPEKIMDTVLEQQRSFHEERERLVDAMSKEMCFKPNTVIPIYVNLIIFSTKKV